VGSLVFLLIAAGPAIAAAPLAATASSERVVLVQPPKPIADFELTD